MHGFMDGYAAWLQLWTLLKCFISSCKTILGCLLGWWRGRGGAVVTFDNCVWSNCHWTPSIKPWSWPASSIGSRMTPAYYIAHTDTKCSFRCRVEGHTFLRKRNLKKLCTFLHNLCHVMITSLQILHTLFVFHLLSWTKTWPKKINF